MTYDEEEISACMISFENKSCIWHDNTFVLKLFKTIVFTPFS